MTELTKAPAALAEARFPPELLEVIRTLKASGHAAFLVGGSVRDILLAKAAKDWDVATGARVPAVKKLFRRVIPTGEKHGTVTVLIKSERFEVTTFRGEGAYADGRHPDSVVFLDDVTGDLAAAAC